MISPFLSELVESEQQCQRHDLARCLDSIWSEYFADVPRANSIQIAYGYPWKNRLGLIRLTCDQTITQIGVNTLLQLSQIPKYVLSITIAHELVHYAHGFGSPLPRLFQHPHANKVVERELERRDLGKQLSYCEEWIDKHWYPFYDMQRASGWAGLFGAHSVRRPITKLPANTSLTYMA